MIPVDELRASFHDAWCSYLVRCGELPDLDTCARALLHQPFPVSRGDVAAVLVGRARFDAAAAEQCFARIAAATCDRTDDDLRPNGDGTDSVFSATANPDVCAGIVRGTVADGGRCSVGAECASRDCYTLLEDCSMACCIGTCGDTHAPLAPGEPCESNRDTCVDGFCAIPELFGTNRCATRVPQGGTCHAGAWDECEQGLACVTSTGFPMMTCQPLPTVGQPCPGGLCRDDGTVCHSSGVCAAAGLTGDACVNNLDCSAFYACDRTGHCAPVVAGAACSGGEHTSCFDDGMVCDFTCMPLAPEGAPCGSQTGRQSRLCASGLCVPTEGGSHGGDSRFGVCAGDAVAPACY